MVVAMQAEVTGLEELVSALNSVGEELQKDLLVDALKIAAKPVVETAKRIAPRSGRIYAGRRKSLADSIRITTVVSRRQRAMMGGRARGPFIAVGTSAPYAHLVEFGHMIRARGPHRRGTTPETGAAFVSPRPFMLPAWKRHSSSYPQSFAQAGRPAIEKMIRRFAREARTGKVSQKTRRAFRGKR